MSHSFISKGITFKMYGVFDRPRSYLLKKNERGSNRERDRDVLYYIQLIFFASTS